MLLVMGMRRDRDLKLCRLVVYIIFAFEKKYYYGSPKILKYRLNPEL